MADLLCICGPTGVGKTKLSIEIARKYGGEIVNCDSMQVYKGMDIATNKITPGENADGIRHHLVGFVSETDCLHVLEYRRRALACIHDIRSRNKLPILVGGTFYYLESVVFGSSSSSSSSAGSSTLDTALSTDSDPGDYEKLKELDPEYALKVHPNNARKIRTALDVCARHQVSYTEYRAKQFSHSTETSCQLGSVVIMCLDLTDEHALYASLDSRVDDMHRRGFLAEMRTCLGAFARANKPIDFSKGVLQCIGLKECAPLFADDGALEPKSDSLLRQCLDRVKHATRKYTRRQKAWVYAQLAPKCDCRHAGLASPPASATSGRPKLYFLTTGSMDTHAWRKSILEPALDLCGRLGLGGMAAGGPLAATDDLADALPPAIQKAAEDGRRRFSDKQTFDKTCDRCALSFRIPSEWDQHLQSRRHRHMKKRPRLDSASFD